MSPVKSGLAAVSLITLFGMSVCVIGGCGNKNEAANAPNGGATAVGSQVAPPPQVQSQINAQQQSEAASRAAHAPKMGP